MGSLHTNIQSAIHGGVHRAAIHRAVVVAAVTIGLVGCSGGSDDSAASGDAPSVTMAATADTASAGAEAPAATDAESDAGGGATDEGATPGTVTASELDRDVLGGPLDVGDPLADRDIAIEARVTLSTDDVRAAVDGVSAAVTTQRGMVAQATVDYAPEVGPDEIDGGGRATIVVKVPPAGLRAVISRLDDFGTVTGFEQFAEDVTEQVTDLGTRIANQRSSVERLRTLLAEAADVDVLLKVEAQLTEAELELERLLAAQRNLGDRVAMSTLTIDVVPSTVTPFSAVTHTFDVDAPGVVEALQRGWDAFVGALFAVVLVLAVGAPFIVVALAMVAIALFLRGTVLRRTVTRRPADPVMVSRSPAERADEPVSASRPE